MEQTYDVTEVFNNDYGMAHDAMAKLSELEAPSIAADGNGDTEDGVYVQDAEALAEHEAELAFEQQS